MDAHLRKDLNHFLSLFVVWPGWGNYELDQPLLTIWELAFDAANRDLDFNEEEMRVHVWGVLERAANPRISVEDSTNEIVREFSRVFQALRHFQSGRKYLPHCRTLEVHRACDPASDPRWQLAPVREEWEGGRVITFACYPQGKPISRSKGHFFSPEVAEYLHRADGPALTSYFERDKKRLQDRVWYKFGRVHRDDGPALVFHDTDGRVRRESWYRDGLLHREDGPAEVWFPAHYENSGLPLPNGGYTYGWQLEGRAMPFTDYLTRVSPDVREKLGAKREHYLNAGSYLECHNGRRGMSRSVFISYGAPDEAEARIINDRLKQNGFTTWFFPDDALPGEKLHRVMSEGVHRHDRVLLVCSRSSLSRQGVQNELERVLEKEAMEGGSSILIPVRIDDYVLGDWAPERPDFARQVRSRVIADFSSIMSWPATFDHEFRKLLMALLGNRE